MPPQPIPKSNASLGLLAHVAVSKYQDALPLQRQEAMLNRCGIDIPRNTLANWMINLLEDTLLGYQVIHCDEIPIQVLKETNKHATQKSYMWVRAGGPPTRPIRLFHYGNSRSGDVARILLADYAGYLQTDDYAGYNTVGAEKTITQLGCCTQRA